jgi:hypothetical protein
MTPVERLEKYIRSRYDTNESFDNLVAGLKEEEKKGSPQDIPAICEYSGLRPVEGYKEEEKDKEDIDKEIKIEKGDIDFMYKWIRSKSGK